jgi:hypothetical protein
MNHKVITVCLMNSRRIHQVLQDLILSRDIHDESHMAIVAALKWLEPAYQGLATQELADDLGAIPAPELVKLARLVHPLLCSLKLEKWLGVSGDCHYLAQSEVPRGAAVRRMLLDGSAREIRQLEAPASMPR